MIIAHLVKGKLSGRLCFDGVQTFFEDTAEEIAEAIRPYLDRPLEYKTSEWVNGEKVKTRCIAPPNTIEHFSALVWFYVPCKAGVGIAHIQNQIEAETDTCGGKE
ncbi:MAG: hypothetical protein ACOYU7_07135 [Bacillota bacterium]